MNKAILCIEILQLLSAKEIMSKNEIADILEINPRNVKEYIKTLQDGGYDIVSTRGIYGGYHLNKDCLIPALRLTQKEADLLKSSCSFLEHQADYLDFQGYLKVISKVLSNNEESFSTDITVIDRYPLAMEKEELLKRYSLFTEAIQSHKKCEILYQSTKNKKHTHIIHPYQVFIFNGAWLILAWNETVNEFGYFKLNRIE
ncbi:MAG: WYL domain-containing protein, partial [Anaeroplasmataceae bacterium]|nr:WYL domain-containing protein [Anaeroplasmataceae bacterium]